MTKFLKKDQLTSSWYEIDAKKDKFIKIKKKNNINLSTKNYNNYAFSLLHNKKVKTSLRNKKIKY